MALVTAASGYLAYVWKPIPGAIPDARKKLIATNDIEKKIEKIVYNSVDNSLLKNKAVPTASTSSKSADVAKITQSPATIPVTFIVDNLTYHEKVVFNSSVYDLMYTMRKNEPFTFVEKNYGALGFLIEEINGVKNNTRANTYWIYYINGSKATVGVSTYILKPNDIITWKYEAGG